MHLPFKSVICINPPSRSYATRSPLDSHHLLLTFDAFGTLFKPKLPIAAQYALVAQEHGLTKLYEPDICLAFKRAYKQESRNNPNFGKSTGMTPNEWWAKIITNTFTTVSSKPLPSSLVPALIHRFASKEAYTLYPDVLPFLHFIRSSPKKWPYTTTTLGVITNSDSRVTSILNDLEVGIREYRPSIPDQPETTEKGVGDKALIDFIVFSYDVGSEKPDPKIFDAARKLWMDRLDAKGTMLATHVGDDYSKDFEGAVKAGWDAILIDREGKRKKWTNNGLGVVKDFYGVMDIICGDPRMRT